MSFVRSLISWEFVEFSSSFLPQADTESVGNIGLFFKRVDILVKQHYFDSGVKFFAGFADEEDRRNHENETNAAQENQFKNRTLTPDQPLIADIDENLAADFDGSLSGLGVEINASTYSMSEALMALPNLSIGPGHMFKQEVSSPPTQHRVPILPHGITPSRLVQCSLKEEPLSNLTANSQSSKGGQNNHNRSSPNLDALDLSSDEAARFPESDNSEEAILGPKTFTGSVSRDGSRNGTPTTGFYHHSSSSNPHQTLSFNAGGNLSSSHPNLTTIGAKSEADVLANVLSLDKGLKLSALQASTSSLVSRKDSLELIVDDGSGEHKFQYVLNASTSIATKVSGFFCTRDKSQKNSSVPHTLQKQQTLLL